MPALNPLSPRAPVPSVLPAPRAIGELLRMIQAEYIEMPGLQLTGSQIQRMWNIDGLTCDALMDVLVDVQFLRRTRQGGYVRADGSTR